MHSRGCHLTGVFLDMDEELYDDVVDTDMKGQYFLLQACARSMVRAKHGGKIVTIVSVAYRGEDMTKLAVITHYNAARAGVIGMTRGIAKELKQYGINVSSIVPRAMVTPDVIANCIETTARYGAEWWHRRTAFHRRSPCAAARLVYRLCPSGAVIQLLRGGEERGRHAIAGAVGKAERVFATGRRLR